MADSSSSANAQDALKQYFPWLAYMPALAPHKLEQPINQGWTFGNVMITQQNSNAPDIEHAIASRVSYGRQIGRVMDAVQALVMRLPTDAREAKAFVDFVELADDVRKVKAQAQVQRLERLQADLDDLKQRDPEAWKRLVKSLRA